MKSFLKHIFFITTLCASIAVAFSLYTTALQADDEIVWGVTFSESQAVYLGLDPQEAYDALIHDLDARHIKIHVNWNSIEETRGVPTFHNLDSYVRKAEEHEVKLILVIGMKTGRWPECHAPLWFAHTPADERRTEILRYIRALVERYKDSDAVEYWQVENESLLSFGTCPSWYYAQGTELLESEVAMVKELDPSREIIISDSGELSSWTTVARIADIVGITMYRSSWNSTQKTFGLNPYTFLSPEFYAAKAAFIQSYYRKPVISIELQAEPWASKPLAEASLEEQAKSMNPELFAETIRFAQEAGLRTYYFWGAEWWYWMKQKHNKPEIWHAAQRLFSE